jgi:hypothetical protein
MSSSALEILASFFLDLRFLKGHLDWHIGTLSRTDFVFLRFEDERRRTKTMTWNRIITCCANACRRTTTASLAIERAFVVV